MLLPKTCRDKTNSTDAKQINFTIFTRRTIRINCFVPLVYFFLLSDKFFQKAEMKRGGKTQKEQDSATDHSEFNIASQCSRISQSNCLLYPTYIINIIIFITELLKPNIYH
jgi:hypothetical protein